MNIPLLSSIPPTLVIDIGLIIIISTILALIARIFKQPLIPAYILAGIIIGPIGLGFIQDMTIIRALSEFGIAFLLFVVGLEINIKRLKYVGLVASLGGLIQVLVVFFASYLITLRLGFANFEAMILGLVLAFSSTMIVIKLLSDTEAIDTLHGRIMLGILLMQDIIIILVLSLVGTVNQFTAGPVVVALLRGILLFAVAFIATRFLLKPLFKFAARSEELLFLTSISILFVFALLAYSLGFSIAIGAFISGVCLASLPYNLEVIGRVTPLKDFFATLFFVSLGMQLVAINFRELLTPIIILLLCIIILKPVIIFFIVKFFGYEKRTSFLTGMSLGQLSEFSLIFLTVPLILNSISQEFFSLVIFLVIITMALTSYLIKYGEQIYLFFSDFLKPFETWGMKRRKLEFKTKENHKTVLLIGCHRMGGIFLNTLQRMKKKVLVIDNNPDKIQELMKRGISCMYGDMTNPEILERIKLHKIKTIISTVPNEQDNKFLINHAKAANPKVEIFVTANHLHQAYYLYNSGADYVILPHILSGEKMSKLLRDVVKDHKNVKKLRKKHIKHLENLDHF